MKTAKSIKFLLPLLAWALWFGWLQYSRYVTDETVLDPDGLTWSAGANKLTAAVSRNRQGELEDITVTVKPADGSTARSLDCQIDWDMGGRGFVRALNVDDDPELEIVCYRSKKGGSSYLDLSSGRAVEIPFDQASAKAHELAQDWLNAHAPSPFVFVALIMLTLAYYGLLFTYLLLVFAVKRIMRRRAESKDRAGTSA
jgi:hypothetical protein